LAGSVGIPVSDADTCQRLYSDLGARRTDGMPVECHVLSYARDGSVSVRLVEVGTVGQCWAQGNSHGVPLNRQGRCARQYSQGFAHWRFDLTREECIDPAHSKLVSLR
jgi:hypothetical protein